jgi:lysyl-tRNA synthetase class 2
MATKEELKKVRLEKLEKLRDEGINPYPTEAKRTHTVEEALKDFKALSKTEKKITLVGRLRSLRKHGGSAFADLDDGTEKIQIFLRKNTVGQKKYTFFFDVFDIGDFIEVKGTLIKTKTGELSILISSFKMLSKSLLPLPEKWHGIKDEDERYRKRYLDIMFDDELKDMIQKRSIFWNSMRTFLMERGFLEVETPVLETTPGGADANPFITHHNALDIDVHLRISMGELWQKRLMVAGLNKTFEIGRQFRNEGMSPEHLQDYTQMEFYWAYSDYKKGMKLVEQMYKYVAKKTFGTLKFKIKGFNVDLGKKWVEYDFQKTVKKYTGIDVFNTTLSEVKAKLDELEVKYDKKGFNLARATDTLWKYCRKKLSGPGFLVGTPISLSPLAKRDPNNLEVSQKFQPIIAGSEVGNGYSELNDPIDQEERFNEQQKLRDAGDEEAQMRDSDFVEALEHGMPPVCGFGTSERLFSFLMNKTAREAQIFPLMKPRD